MKFSISIAGSFPSCRWSRRPPGLRRTPGLRGQRGVALIEALVSILIFSFGVIGLIGLEARAINFSVDAEDRNRAALFASEVASTLWLSGNGSGNVATAIAANLGAWQTRVADPTGAGLPTGVINVVQVGTTNAADITITWKPPQRATTDSSKLTTRVILP
jgi:type IV pilus assembly protein PilV